MGYGTACGALTRVSGLGNLVGRCSARSTGMSDVLAKGFRSLGLITAGGVSPDERRLPLIRASDGAFWLNL